ncbi:MAG: carbohydrate-binding module family 20 domain-containing protein [Candidatus Eisenbacteria bacterium]
MRIRSLFAAVFAGALLAGAASALPEAAPGGVKFSYRSPGATSVHLAGEMNAWSSDATPMARHGDVWSVVLPLEPGMYRYKFVVDGNQWKEDPDNPTKVDDNYGGFNSLLVVKADGSVSFREEDREFLVTDDYGTDRDGIYLNLIWHQHQPLYLDPVRDELQGPWVRAHGTKDYYDMAAILEAYPKVHYNVNLTSVLLFQLQKYYVERLAPFVDAGAGRVDASPFLEAWGGRTDPWIDLALRPTESFGPDEDALLWKNPWNAFGVSDVVIARFPQYAALKAKGGGFSVDEKRAIKFWHYLAWFDPDFLRGPVKLPGGWTVDLSDLVAEDENGSFRLTHAVREEDANRIVAETYKVLASVVPIHEKLMYDPETRSGQIEVMTTPYYHPILPLVYDTDAARVCQPGDAMPRRFSHPEDAEAQVAKAVPFYESLFGRAPAGMWPGEGSVSEAIVPVLSAHGIRWMATADRVLQRSSPPGQPITRPYRVEVTEGGRTGSVAVVFRDTPLSDRIGFRYQRLFGEEAADDFIRQVLAAAPEKGGEDHLLTVILDGENAWEWYVRDNDGKDFLHALYRKLSKLYDERKIVTVTMTEYIEGNPDRGVPAHPVEAMASLDRLWPGSWIDANFATWIGEPEENRAWDVLGETREALAASGIPAPPFEAPAPGPGEPGHAAYMAWEEMYAAEGSDWLWWYGNDQNAPGGDDPFDAAFLTHVNNVYRYAKEAGAAIEGNVPASILSGGGRKDPLPGGGATAMGAGEKVPVLFTCDATAQKVTKAIYVVGNQPELANWTPNEVAMYDDGSHGDAAAEDGVWSLLLDFPAGTRVEYKYTNSGAPGSWSPSEEFPVENRGLSVSGNRVTTRDVFGDKAASSSSVD